MMTAAQNEALLQIQRIIVEHFEFGIAIMGGEVEGEGEQTFTQYIYHGPKVAAIGLMELVKHRIVTQPTEEPE